MGWNCVKNSFNSYPLDRLAQAAGEAAVRDTAYFEETRGKIMATRTWVTHRLREMGFQVHDSSSNFLFIAHPDHSGRVLQQGCGTGACWCAGLNALGYRTICGCPSGQTRRWRPCAGLWKRF